MIDEMACRRPDVFDEAGSIPITLANGQDWLFPRPAIELFPRAGGKMGSRTSLGPDFDRAIDAIRDIPPSDESTDPDVAMEREAAYLMGQFSLAALMLGRNYLIPEESLCEILRFSYQNDTYKQMWDDIIAVAMGSDPRPKVGTGS
jgi:hypothetical protein